MGNSFNSRLREEATNEGSLLISCLLVSTHASVRRRPSSVSTFGARAPVSTHASVRRRQQPSHNPKKTDEVSTHASVRRRHDLEGGHNAFPNRFNSRLREEATAGSSARFPSHPSFNSRLREEATASESRRMTHATRFNSRLREEATSGGRRA